MSSNASPRRLSRQVRLDLRLSRPLDAERLLAMTRHRKHNIYRFEVVRRRDCHMWLECADAAELTLLLARIDRMPGIHMVGEPYTMPLSLGPVAASSRPTDISQTSQRHHSLRR